jgi:hypothetical protein
MVHTLKKALAVGGILLLLLIVTGAHLAQGGEGDEEPIGAAEVTATNLLSNPTLDTGGYYFRPPNHFVAGMWYEWFWTSAIPEFIDGGHPYHNQCYPVPTSGTCASNSNHSQGYIRWGDAFIAGMYQPVTVTPCAMYRFEAYNRNDTNHYHPKVGIDPTGWVLPAYVPPDGDSLEWNCPPDGHTKCPNPGVDTLSELPATLIWGPTFDHAAYTWAKGSVEAEARASKISVWTYTAPAVSGSMSSYWDYLSLTQVAFPNDRLPTPSSWNSSFVTGVTSTTGTSTLTVQWNTSSAASTQVWYNHFTPTLPISISASSVYTTYFPVVYASAAPPYATTLNTAPVLAHTAVITGLTDGEIVTFVVLSRRLSGGSCVTEGRGSYVMTFHNP